MSIQTQQAIATLERRVKEEAARVTQLEEAVRALTEQVRVLSQGREQPRSPLSLKRAS